MTFLAKKLTHISRLFSAHTSTSLLFWSMRVGMWAILLTVISMNIKMRTSASSFSHPAVQTVLQSPLSLDAHRQLAQYFWNAGLQSQARREVSFAQMISANPITTVLGDSTSLDKELAKWNDQPHQYRLLFEFWNNETLQKPMYRDAYIQAAVAAMRLGDTNIATKLLQQAHALDPNDITSIRLLSSRQNIPQK